MKQRTHTWLAIRAIALLEDEGKTPNLVKLLKPHVKSAAIGSWIPDMADSKKGFGDIDNHIFKLKPYTGPGKARFTESKQNVIEHLGPERKIGAFIESYHDRLPNNWWTKPYKAEPQPGQHLANRSMALSTNLVDQLILADTKVAPLVPGTVRFAHNLDDNARTRSEEIATYCFMLSHFVADSCQPLHCDARKMTGYSAGVHKQLEAHWNKYCGTYFNKKKLMKNTESPQKVLQKARSIDSKIGITFSNNIPQLTSSDLWLEVVHLCRASFTVSSILVPPSKIPYSSDEHTNFDELFKGTTQSEKILSDLDKAVLHDSVVNIAMAWKDVWERF